MDPISLTAILGTVSGVGGNFLDYLQRDELQAMAEAEAAQAAAEAATAQAEASTSLTAVVSSNPTGTALVVVFAVGALAYAIARR